MQFKISEELFIVLFNCLLGETLFLNNLANTLIFFLFQRPLETPDEQASQDSNQTSQNPSSLSLSAANQPNGLSLPRNNSTHPSPSPQDREAMKQQRMKQLEAEFLYSPLRSFRETSLQTQSYSSQPSSQRPKERQSYTEGVISQPHDMTTLGTPTPLGVPTPNKISAGYFGGVAVADQRTLSTSMRPSGLGVGMGVDMWNQGSQSNRSSLGDCSGMGVGGVGGGMRGQLLIDYLPGAHLAQLRAHPSNVN